jgi:group I intron endonuclease
MSKIYKIINDINDKVYVGKTKSTIEKRFREHCADSTRCDEESRPLYRAMNKYGIEHFSIHLIEECSDEDASAREQYWIGFYKGYTEGYNATLGGDGKSYIDVSELLKLWSLGKSLKEIAEITHHDKGWVSNLLKENGIDGKDIVERSQVKRQVQMLDKKTGAILQIFSSTREAARWLIESKGLAKSSEGGYSSHISEACNGKRKSCSGYKWQYVIE